MKVLKQFIEYKEKGEVGVSTIQKHRVKEVKKRKFKYWVCFVMKYVPSLYNEMS